MKIITYNINSIRSRLESTCNFLKQHQPDILGLQETKVQDHDFPAQPLIELGYHPAIHGQKTHHGVATLSKHAPLKTQIGSDFEEDQARFIYTQHNTNRGLLHFVNGYFPQGDNRKHPLKFPYKQRFYAGFFNWLQNNFNPDEDNLIILGDFNIAPVDYDIGIGAENQKRWLRTGKCSFLPEERAMLEPLFNWGLIDAYRHLYPTSNEFYSWFDYRSRGFEDNPKRGLRIDYALCTKPVLAKLRSASMDYVTRAEAKPSDHCPVFFEFELEYQA